MATSKEYAYYIKGNKLAIVQKDWTFSGGQTITQPGLNDVGQTGALLWKSPKDSVADGLEIQYGSYIVLRKAGKWNGLHKVKAAGAGYITLYTKCSDSSTVQQSFEEAPELYYNVNFLDSETDELDIPRYLSNAVVQYVKAKYAEDAGEIEMREYFMREFRRTTEKYQSGRKMGSYRIQGFNLMR